MEHIELKRFAFRPEISILYDRKTGVEHHLDEIGLCFVDSTFSSSSIDNAIAKISNIYDVDIDVIRNDFNQFWVNVSKNRFEFEELKHGGAPSNWAKIDLPFPLVLEMELTKICNWHCDFCYNVWKVNDSYEEYLEGRHLPLDKAISVLDEAAKNNCLRVRFSGGEPTLHPNIREIICHANSLGLDISLFTNGSKMTPEFAKFLIDNGVREVLISIHGEKETHNKMAVHKRAYDHSFKSMKHIIDSGGKVIAETLICEDNLEDVQLMLIKLEELGVKDFRFMPYVAHSNHDKRKSISMETLQKVINDSYSLLNKKSDLRVPCSPKLCLSEEPMPVTSKRHSSLDNHCAAGLLWASISYDGKIRHCPHSSVFAGNINEGVGKVWQERMVPTIRKVTDFKNEKCSSCSIFSECKSGCHLTRVISYETEIINV